MLKAGVCMLSPLPPCDCRASRIQRARDVPGIPTELRREGGRCPRTAYRQFGEASAGLALLLGGPIFSKDFLDLTVFVRVHRLNWSGTETDNPAGG